MLFNLTSVEKPALQRQLDADRVRFSRELELQTDAAFEHAELKEFRMQGLFGEIPGSGTAPMPMEAR